MYDDAKTSSHHKIERKLNLKNSLTSTKENFLVYKGLGDVITLFKKQFKKFFRAYKGTSTHYWAHLARRRTRRATSHCYLIQNMS